MIVRMNLNDLAWIDYVEGTHRQSNRRNEQACTKRFTYSGVHKQQKDKNIRV